MRALTKSKDRVMSGLERMSSGMASASIYFMYPHLIDGPTTTVQY